jgi:gliding motility-associated-like protein
VIQDVEDSLSGAFILYATDKLGCKDTFTTNVLIYPRPYIKPIANEPVCAGEPLQLYSQGGGNYQYRWSGPLGYTSTAVNPRINTTTAAESGKYMVYAAYQADANNLCRDSSGVKVTVFAIPQSQFMLTPQSKLYLTETEYELHDLSKGAVTWRYYLNNEYWSDKPKTNFVRTEAGSLLIKQVVTSSDWSVYSSGNCMDSSEQVYIIDDKPKIWLPNAFTPNNNSRNDMFYPVTVNITEYRLRIYNRWGQKIFDEVNGKWNGIDKSGLWHPIGPYAVYVTYKDITGLEGEVEGSVTLLR